MTAKKHEGTGLDDLLKRALADDLPAEVAAGMRDRIGRFRDGTTRDERRTAALAWLSRRTVWAAIAVLMLISGGLLQGLGSRNPLADRIAVIKAKFSSRESDRRPGVTPELRLISPGGSLLERRNNHDRDS
jgi:hypothetical protein